MPEKAVSKLVAMKELRPVSITQGHSMEHGKKMDPEIMLEKAIASETMEDPHEISKRFIEEHRRRMEEWFQAQLDRLIEQQPCASDAVALEWLMKRPSTSGPTKKGKARISQIW